jgi:hypothetical protein
MAQVIRQLHLSRRALLRGAGVAVALPWLDAMQPALRPAPAAPQRALFVFAPNGVHVEAWRPRGERLPDGLSPTLEPLAGVAAALTAFSGFAIDAGRAHQDGTGDHARNVATFLTCTRARKTGGADIQAGVSIDQVLAATIGGRTPFPSLELGLEAGRSAGVCDSGYSCAYSNNISWRTPTTPVAKESSPRAVFARLFGDPDQRRSQAEEERRRLRLRSVLDAALADFKRLRRDLPSGDQRKLDEYAEAVRAVEARVARLEAEDEAEILEPRVADEIAKRLRDDGVAARMGLFYELIALAFATDRSRIVTLMLGNAGSDRSHRFLGAPEAHHELSHHGRNPEKLEKIARIDRFQIEQFAAFLTRLQATRDGRDTLLDAAVVLYGSGIADGNRHNHDQLPILLAGRGGGRLRTGRHVRFAAETPLADLHLTIARVLGVELEGFADSRGPVEQILA